MYPRYRATCVVYKNCMILYGGHDGTRHLSDTFTFDFDTLTWNALLTDGTQPIPRDSHVSVIHGNSMYVFGGSSGVAMNDFHELQLPSGVTNTPSSSNSNNSVSSNNHSSAVARWRPIHTSTSATTQSDGQQYPRHRFCHVAIT
jgi:Kelch motif